MKWSAEQVLSLAPDAGTEKRGRALAREKKWPLLCSNEQAVWGHCKGTGAQPYLTCIDLSEPAFKCNCPSRKFPCKHALGLFYLYIQSEKRFEPKDSPPHWVSEWISKRQASNAVDTPVQPKDEKAEKAKQKRWEKRLVLMEDGLIELRRWLEDLVSQGFGQMALTQPDFWESIAARMVDAKMPRLGTVLREMGAKVMQQGEWQEQLVETIGDCYLQLRAFEQREKLSPPLREALFSSLGRSFRKADLLQTEAEVADHWWVLGIEQGQDIERREFRRTWLLGEQSERYALLLDFSFGQQGFEQQYRLGQCIVGQLVFYPSSYPQRALVKQQQIQPLAVLPQLPSYAHWSAMLDTYALALKQQPWLETWPARVDNLYPNPKGELIDAESRALPFALSEEGAFWPLLSLSAGEPLCLFGIWDGREFKVLMVEQADYWIPL